jgi:hypothetical protein
MLSSELKQIGMTKRFRQGEIQYEIMVYANPDGFHAVWRCKCRTAGRTEGASETADTAISAARRHLK